LGLEAGIDLVKQMLESRAAASGAVIEGTAKPVSMLAHAELEQPQRKRPNRLLEHTNTAVGPIERRPEAAQGAIARKRVISWTWRGISVLSGISHCQSRQNSLKRSGAISVYLTVC